jgi:hypothetical protein
MWGWATGSGTRWVRTSTGGGERRRVPPQRCEVDHCQRQGWRVLNGGGLRATTTNQPTGFTVNKLRCAKRAKQL